MAKKRFEKNKTDIRSLDRERVGGKGSRKKKRRRSSYTRIALVVTVLAVAAVGVALSLTVFFKIKNVDVSANNTAYSSKQIITAGKIQFDSNLIRLDSDSVENRIEKALPYIEEAKVKKILPTTVELEVKAATVAGYVKTETGYAIISTKGKVLETLTEDPVSLDRNLAEIKGISAEKVGVADFVPDENNMLAAVDKIYSQLGSALSKEVTEINVTERINLSFVYRDRIEVRLGSESEIAEKIKFVALLIADSSKIDSDDMGIIYASNPKRVSFLRKGSYSEYLAEQEKLQAEQNPPVDPEIEGEENEQNSSENSSQNTSPDKENQD